MDKNYKTYRIRHVLWSGLFCALFNLLLTPKIHAEESLYVVIDISEGPNASTYPVTYLPEVPEGGWTDEYKTTKIVLRRIEPGTFTMGSPYDPDKEFYRHNNETQHQVTLTDPFYIGVFEVTQSQWELVMGYNPSYHPNGCYNAPPNYFPQDLVPLLGKFPVESVDYMAVRGLRWGNPTRDAMVNPDSFMGKLRMKAGLTFDLPTEAQWEYACRAGCGSMFYNGTELKRNKDNTIDESGLQQIGRYDGNSRVYYSSSPSWILRFPAPVGCYEPNNCGLYDMVGNVCELCQDWSQQDLGTASVTNPICSGMSTSASSDSSGPVTRGGCFQSYSSDCTVSTRSGYAISNTGFRLYAIAENGGDGLHHPITAIVNGYSGRYDGNGHGINVIVSFPSDGATVKYSLSANGPYSEEAPLFTNVCRKTVWVELSATGYATITNSAVVNIENTSGRYAIVDVSGGPDVTNYPVSFLANVPDGGWTDEYKTDKIVLRLVEPGTFIMGNKFETTLTKAFYTGVFEVTQKQWENVMGSNPSNSQGDARPVECVSYDAIRGADKGAQWPTNNEVDEDSFMGRLRVRTGIAFDLPTEAQWEYACRAGTTTDFNSGDNLANVNIDPKLAILGRYWKNSNDGKGGYAGITTVGSYLPNAWGLYDMHGNVWEWCLDWSGNLSNLQTDPVGAANGSNRVGRGGSCQQYVYEYYAQHCTSSYREYFNPENGAYYGGFRLTVTIQDYSVGFGLPIEVKTEGHTGIYDGEGHGVSVSVTTPATDAVVKYAHAENGPYSTQKPLFTNVCNQAVWIEISAANYAPTTNSATVKIDPRPLTIAAEAMSKTYGEADPELTYTATGLVEGDTITGELGREAGESVGQYTIKQGTLTAGGNYAVAYTEAKFTISKATLLGGTEEPGNGIVTVSGLSKFDTMAVYDGQGHTIDTNMFIAAFAEAMDGEVTVAHALDNNGSADATTWGPSPNLYTNAGEYVVWYRVSNPNYEDFSHSAKIVIAPRALTVAAEPKTKKQGEADPELTYAVTGLLPCDELGVELEREAGEAAGTYAITLKSAAISDNYAMSFVAAVLTIQSLPPRTYKVIFHSNGGNGKMTEQTIEYDKATALTRNAYSHGSHVFLGWSKTKGGAVVYGDGETVKNLAVPGASVTLYAAWAKKNYQVAFIANGGTASNGKKMAAESMTYGTSKKLSKNLFTRKGYVFIGWSLTKTGAIAYTDAQSVKNLRTDGKTTTLYAKWAKKTYKIAFYANGGKGKMAAQTMTYGKAKKLTANKFARKGYVFKGWAKSKKLAKKGKVTYKNGKKVKNLVTNGKTVKLYAVWKKK